MYYTTKMKIGSGIASGFGILAEVIFLLTGITVTNQFKGGFVSGPDLLYLVLSGVVCLLSGFIAASFYGSGMKRLVKNMQSFRTRANFCYSCGESLQTATTADLCPSCNSKVNLADVIDT